MIEYLALLPIILLLLTASVLIAIRLLRPAFAYSWLIAALGALITWVIVLLLHGNILESVPLSKWEPDWLFAYSPALLVDPISWAYAFSIATLLLSVTLTDAARQVEANWLVWTSNLLLCAIGIAAVQSGNPLTLLMLWTVLDLVEGSLFLYLGRNEADVKTVILSFSSRILGTLLLIWAMLYTANSGMALAYDQLPRQAGILLLAAAILRLGLIPIQGPIPHDSPLRRNLGTFSRLNTAAASLILVTRFAGVDFQTPLTLYLIILFGIVSAYAAVMWFIARDEIEGQPYWILGIAVFSIASAQRLQPEASLAWGVVTILTGGLIFLLTRRNRYLSIVLIFGILTLTTLPYTPAWNGVLLYTPGFSLPLFFFLISQSIFMAGYLRFMLLPAPDQTALERWVWVIYPWGLVIIPVSLYIIGWQVWNIELSVSTVLPGVLVTLFGGIWLALVEQLRKRPATLQTTIRIINAINQTISLGWIYRSVGKLYQLVGRFFTIVVAVFEGDGGVLWALFFLVLFIAILAQIRLGV